MKKRMETHVTNAFTVDAIVTVYHFPVPDVEPDARLEDRDVSYDFWQLYYVERGEYVCRLDGKERILRAGQVLFCEPGKVRTTLRQRDALVGIISFRCKSEDMELLKKHPDPIVCGNEKGSARSAQRGNRNVYCGGRVETVYRPGAPDGSFCAAAARA